MGSGRCRLQVQIGRQLSLGMKKPLRVRSRHASTPVEREAVEGLAFHGERGGLTPAAPDAAAIESPGANDGNGQRNWYSKVRRAGELLR